MLYAICDRCRTLPAPGPAVAVTLPRCGRCGNPLHHLSPEEYPRLPQQSQEPHEPRSPESQVRFLEAHEARLRARHICAASESIRQQSREALKALATTRRETAGLLKRPLRHEVSEVQP